MPQNYKQDIQTVIDLSKQVGNGITWDQFSNHLENLDFETIKVIQTIMYIGRDDYFQSSNGTYDYNRSRQSLDEMGWNTKKIEVAQIAEKHNVLAKYLENGCKKIELVI